MIKKIQWGLLILTLVTAFGVSVPVHAQGQEAALKNEDGFEYEIRNNGAIIWRYTGNDTVLTLPDTLGGAPVKAVFLYGVGNNGEKVESITLSRYIEYGWENLSFDLAAPTRTVLKEIKVVEENPYLTAQNGILYSKDMKHLIAYPAGKTDTEYIMPDKVEASDSKYDGYDGNVLAGQPYLKKITFSSNSRYKTVHSCAGMKNLESIVLLSNITSISTEAFSECRKLKDIVWSNHIREIGAGAFESCDSLRKVKIPDSVTVIGQKAFDSCRNLKSVVLPKGLIEIKPRAFRGCRNLKKKIVIPDSVQRIGANAFYSCKAKIVKPSYLKKKVSKTDMEDGKKRVYTAMATVRKAGAKKGKEYLAEDITKIKAAKKRFVLNQGGKTQLNTIVSIKKKKAGYLDAEILKFSTSNKKVIRVTEKGQVEAKKKGTAVVTVTLRTTGRSYKVKVKVR